MRIPKKVKSNHDKHEVFEKALPGDLFFSRSKTFVSWLIRKITKFHSSHVFVKVNGRTVIESDIGGVNIHPAKKYLDDYTTEFECVSLPNSVCRKKFIENLSEKIGCFYDYGILLGGVISRVFRINRWRDMIFNAASRYTCSEYVAEALSNSGMDFTLPTSQITPKDLYYSLKRKTSDNLNMAPTQRS